MSVIEADEEPDPLFLTEEDVAQGHSNATLKRTRSRQVEQDLMQARLADATGSTKSFFRRCLSRLRPDFVLNHRDSDSFKIALRSWLNIWVLLVILTIRKPELWVGPSSYFANIATVVQLAGGKSLGATVLEAVATMLYMTVVFTHFVVTRAIINRLHGSPTQQEVYERIFSAGECRFGDNKCAELALLDGRYIQLRVTVITCFAVVFALTPLGYLAIRRAYLRPSFILCLFAGYISFLQSNHLPYFEPWQLGRGVMVAIGLACASNVFWSALIFPVSSNKKIISYVTRATRTAHSIARDLFREQYNTKPSDGSFSKLLDDFPKRAVAALKPLNALITDRAVSAYELSYSRFDSADLLELSSRVQGVSNSLYSFKFFFMEFQERAELTLVSERSRNESVSRRGTRPAPLRTPTSRARANTFDYGREAAHRGPRLLRRQQPAHYKHASAFEERRREQFLGAAILGDDARGILSVAQLDRLYADVLSHYAPLLELAQGLLVEVGDWLEEANKWRLSSLFLAHRRKKHVERQQERQKSLERAMNELVLAYEALMKNQAFPRDSLKSKNYSGAQYNFVLVEDAFYGFLCKEYARLVRKVGRWCLYLDSSQPTPRFNTFFSKKHRQMHRRTGYEKFADFDPPVELKNYEPLNGVQARNVDSSPPQNLFHYAGAYLYSLKGHFLNRETSYSLKRAAVGLIPGILYFCRPTLDFAYSNRLVWASIMAGMTMAARPADTIYGLGQRIVMSFLGGIAGMVAWYVCAGKGDGNAIGYAAIQAPITAIVVYYGHFSGAKLPVGNLVFGFTVYLVAGSSWISTHDPQVGYDLQPGWGTFWHRLVCVIAGVTLAFIATMLPRPQTAKKAIRLIHGSSLKTIGDIQASLINFAMQRYDDPTVRSDPVEDDITKSMRTVFTKLAAIDNMQVILEFEPPLTGVWPWHHYALLLKLEREIIHMMPFLYSLINTFRDTARIPELLNRLGWSNPQILSGAYAVLYMSARAIITGEPLPSVTPGILSEQYFWHLKEILSHQGAIMDHVENEYLDHDGRWIMAGIKMVGLLYERLDGIIMLIKGLVGEYHDTDPRLFDFNVEYTSGMPSFHFNEHAVDP